MVRPAMSRDTRGSTPSRGGPSPRPSATRFQRLSVMDIYGKIHFPPHFRGRDPQVRQSSPNTFTLKGGPPVRSAEISAL